MSDSTTTIPKGSLILVTGATGFVASHLLGHFLSRGYKVRGTVRDLNQASWVKDIYKDAKGSGNLELVVVPDLAAPNAFDDAIKGVSVITHVASVTTFDPDPNKVVTPTVDGVRGILEAAAKEPSVKGFVYTGSVMAATFPVLGNDTHVGDDTWNHLAIDMAWAPPPYEPERGGATYSASKAACEQEVLRFARERKPHFRVNVVSPCGILGEPLHKKHTEGPGSWVTELWNGNSAVLDTAPAGAFYSNVKDLAVLHVAAALDPEVSNARLHTWGHLANWNDLLAILRELRPQRDFMPDRSVRDHLTMSTDQSQSIALLKKWAGQGGWTSLKDTVADGIDNEFFG